MHVACKFHFVLESFGSFPGTMKGTEKKYPDIAEGKLPRKFRMFQKISKKTCKFYQKTLIFQLVMKRGESVEAVWVPWTVECQYHFNQPQPTRLVHR